jgi:hypothetical protein
MTLLAEKLSNLEVKKDHYYIKLKVKDKVLVKNFRSLKQAQKAQLKLIKEGFFPCVFDKKGEKVALYSGGIQ